MKVEFYITCLHCYAAIQLQRELRVDKEIETSSAANIYIEAFVGTTDDSLN